MPTVLRIDGLRVVTDPNDHRPAHVHVIGPDGEAVFFLNCPNGPPEPRECVGFKRTDANRIRSKLSEVLATLCDEWSKLHGNY